MSGDIDYPPDDVLAWRNRQIIAERAGWPEGVLEACEETERRFPGWRVWWLAENRYPGWERPACFWAVREAIRGHHEVFAPDAAALEQEILQAPEPPEQFGWLSSLVRPE